MKERKKQQSGITLVALVITIIILLILAGIAISAITNQGIFTKAGDAKNVTVEEMADEREKLTNYEEQMNEILGGTSGGSSGGTENTLVDTEDTKPAQAMPANATVIENDLSKGIVIKDSSDNEWVWIEVPKTEVFSGLTIDTEATLTEQNYTDIKNKLISYATTYRKGAANQNENWTDEWYSGCGIADSSTYTETYKKMLSSVYKNGGFWISRYEIGDSTATASNATRTSSSGVTGEAVSKENQIPYNYVTCSQAQTLASGMSTDTNKTSSLLFGIQWDLVCKFLEVNVDWDTTTKTASYYLNSHSESWGNYPDSSLTLNRGKYNTDPGSSTSTWEAYNVDTGSYVKNSQTSSNIWYYQLLTTGASDQTKKMNIYDFAGNEWEWTLEKTSDTSYPDYPCASRGGNYKLNGSSYPASYRGYDETDNSYHNVGFRSALY